MNPLKRRIYSKSLFENGGIPVILQQNVNERIVMGQVCNTFPTPISVMLELLSTINTDKRGVSKNKTDGEKRSSLHIH